MKILNWGSQPGGHYVGVSVPLICAVPARPAYLPRSPEIRAPLRAASVTVFFERTVWHVSKVSPISATSSMIIW